MMADAIVVQLSQNKPIQLLKREVEKMWIVRN